jgi:hypothetical protein
VPPAAQVPWKRAARRWPGRSATSSASSKGGWPDYRNPQDLPDSRTVLWVRDQPPRPLDAPALAAIADVFYPRVFRRRQRFTPAGTVSITTYFHADAAAFAAQGDRAVLASPTGAASRRVSSTRRPSSGATTATCWPAATRSCTSRNSGRRGQPRDPVT